MLKKGSSFAGKTKKEILYTDFKNYPVNDYKIGVAQVLTTNPDELLDEKDEFIDLMNTIAHDGEYRLIMLLITDILNNNSYLLYTDGCEKTMKNTFNLKEINEGIILKDIVSRKLKVTLQGEDLETFNKVLAMLDDVEDVNQVYHNVEL